MTKNNAETRRDCRICEEREDGAAGDGLRGDIDWLAVSTYPIE